MYCPPPPSVRGPHLPLTCTYIQEPSLKFETGSYFLKSTKKPVTLGKQDKALQYMYVMF